MTLVLNLAPEAEAIVRTEAAARGIAIESAVVEAVTEWAARRPPISSGFDSSGIDELIALAQKMPRHRDNAGLGPLPDNAVELDYDDRESQML